MRHGVTRTIGSVMRMVVILAFALAGSQLAAFMNAYEQNLAGRVAEAELGVAGIVDRAKAADLPLYAYLETFHGATDPIFVREGAALRAEIDRAAFLADDLGALERASVTLKPVVFFGRLDPDIALSVWRRFVPSLPFDGASLIYIGGALLLGLAVAECLGLLARLVGHLATRRPPPALAGDH